MAKQKQIEQTWWEEVLQAMGVVFCLTLLAATLIGISYAGSYVIDRLDDIKKTKETLQQYVNQQEFNGRAATGTWWKCGDSGGCSVTSK